MKITDDLEKEVAKILKSKGIKFVHESYKNGIDQRLDFYLPDFDVYLEVKKFHTERTIQQLEYQRNVILIQGRNQLIF